MALLRKQKPWPSQPSHAPKGKVKTETIAKTKGSKSRMLPSGSSSPKSSSCSQSQFSDEIPQEVAKDVGIPSSLEDGSLMHRGSRKLFYCNSRLVSALSEPREKPFSLVSAGVCAFRLNRSPHSNIWHLTPGGMSALKLNRNKNKEANAAAAKKSLEGHTCSACGEHRHGSFFSRKMLTRPPSKRKCSDCVAPGQKMTAALATF